MYRLLAYGIVFNKLDEQVRVVEEGNEAARNTKADAVKNDDDVMCRSMCDALAPPAHEAMECEGANYGTPSQLDLIVGLTC